jgi:hypothetical protein
VLHISRMTISNAGISGTVNFISSRSSTLLLCFPLPLFRYIGQYGRRIRPERDCGTSSSV